MNKLYLRSIITYYQGTYQCPADKFRTGTYLVIIDSIVVELEKRLSAYEAAVLSKTYLRTKLLSMRTPFTRRTRKIMKNLYQTS